MAAWLGLDGIEERSALRAGPPGPTRVEPIWLEPYPDILLAGLTDRTPGPDGRYGTREALGLAFVAGLQRLPPTQRAVLVLCEVVGFRAAEVADILDTSEASVTSSLQRARVTLERRLPGPDRKPPPPPSSARERELVGRFAAAFERDDVDSIVALLTPDAWLAMPPLPLHYQGSEAIGRFLSTVSAGRRLERFRLVPTRANTQPAFGLYLEDPDCQLIRVAGLMVLTLEGDRVAAVSAFHDTSLLPRFGLPRTLPA